MLFDCQIQLFVALRAHLHFAAHFLCLACMQACLSQLYSFSSVFEYDVHQLDTSLPSKGCSSGRCMLGEQMIDILKVCNKSGHLYSC